MADTEKKTEPAAGGYVVPDQGPVPEEILRLAAGVKKAEPTPDPLACPTCAATLSVQRHTPDFATHHTVVCPACGYREKRAD